MNTRLGEYLEKLDSNKSKIGTITGITTDRINALSHEATAIQYADEVYRIIFVANYLAKISEADFDKSIDEICLNRKKGTIINSLESLSPAGKLFGKYTLTKRQVEKHVGMPKGKISKYIADKTKRVTIEEFVNFADGIGLDLLKTFKEIYGEVSIS